jgi:DNA polymerase-4
MHPFRTIYIDMNSFFASVEQHEEPALRRKPVGITAMEGDVGCLVAASYEAKYFGVKTTMNIQEAKTLCPKIILRPSRHRLYVHYNQRIAKIFDRYAELEYIRSIDEFQIALGGQSTHLEFASKLVQAMKSAINNEIGKSLQFSAGIGSNHLLAKIAGKLEKPNGMQWLSPENMPNRLAEISLNDLPGITKGILYKVNAAGIYSIPEIYNLDPMHARKIWGSIEGERFVRLLHGENIPLGIPKRGGYGNSKMLAPENRTLKNSYFVSRWLIEKSVARLRRDNYTASQFTLFIGIQKPKGHWVQSVKTHYSQDIAHFLDINRGLWLAMYARERPYSISSIFIQLRNILPLSKRPSEMFLPMDMAKQNQREHLSKTIDTINCRFGASTVTYGINKAHNGFFERG